MNKKKVLLIILAIVILIGVLEYMSRSSHDINGRAYYIITDTFVFDPNEYSEWIDLPSDRRSVGEITDEKDAVNKAIILWSEICQLYDGGFNAMYHQPYYAYHDADYGCWLIMASVSQYALSSMPKTLLLDDGTVLSVWYD